MSDKYIGYRYLHVDIEEQHNEHEVPHPRSQSKIYLRACDDVSTIFHKRES